MAGFPAHRFMGACCTLVASADSSLRTRLRPLLAASHWSRGRAEGRARPHAPRREPLAIISEASAELARPQRPERADASESLSVLHMSHQQRRTGCEAWCEERAGTASPEASMRAKGCVFICPINHEKQRGDVSRNGAGADLLVVRPRGFANMTECQYISEGGPGYRASVTTCRGPTDASQTSKTSCRSWNRSGEAHAVRGGAPLSVP